MTTRVRLTRYALSVFGILLLFARCGFGYDDGDWQMWLKARVRGEYDNQVRVSLETESRAGDNANEHYEQNVTLIADYPVNGRIRVGIGMGEAFTRRNKNIYTENSSDGVTAYAPTKPSDHYWAQEDRPLVELTLTERIKGWKLEDRIRAEYRMKDGEDEYFRFRNRLRLTAPWKWTAAQWNPYTAWEIYFNNADTDDCDRHRFYAGLRSRLSEGLSSDLYYMLQRDDKGEEWLEYNVVGWALTFDF